MFEFNWKSTILLMIIAAMLFLLLFAITASAIAPVQKVNLPENLVKAYPADNETIAMNGSVDVHQMDTIYWYDVADLALVEGWTGILENPDTGAHVDVSSFTHKIYIDPAIFTDGEWDQWSDFDAGHGNNVAFYVDKYRPAPKNQTEEQHPVNGTIVMPYTQPIAVKHVADILVAHGDPLNVALSRAKVWIFGKNSLYYDFLTVDNAIALNVSQIESLSPGTYTLIVEQPSNKTPDFTMRYNTEKQQVEYFDAKQFKVVSIDFIGLDSTTRLKRFEEVQAKTSDLFTYYSFEVQDPYIEIKSLDQQYINDTTFAQTIKGYTNAKIGTQLKFVVDEDKQITTSDKQYSTFYTLAEGSPMQPGNMRWFEITVPLLWSNFAPGHHTVSASSAIGGDTHVDFNVYESPEHSFIPNNTVKYVNGSEWIEPVIVEKTIIIPPPPPITIIQTVTVPVPPPQESVNAAQYDANVKLATNILILVAVVAFIGFGIWYTRSLYCRLRDRKQDRRRGKW